MCSLSGVLRKRRSDPEKPRKFTADFLLENQDFQAAQINTRTHTFLTEVEPSPVEGSYQDISDIPGELEKEVRASTIVSRSSIYIKIILKGDGAGSFKNADGGKADENPSEAAGDGADQTNEENNSDTPAPKDDVNNSAVLLMEHDQNCGGISTTLSNPKEVQDVTEQWEAVAGICISRPPLL